MVPLSGGPVYRNPCFNPSSCNSLGVRQGMLSTVLTELKGNSPLFS
jgi:hypothetical protein